MKPIKCKCGKEIKNKKADTCRECYIDEVKTKKLAPVTEGYNQKEIREIGDIGEAFAKAKLEEI